MGSIFSEKYRENYFLPYDNKKYSSREGKFVLLDIVNSKSAIVLAGKIKKDYLGGILLEKLFKLNYLTINEYRAGIYFLRLLYKYQVAKKRKRDMRYSVLDRENIIKFKRLNNHLINRNKLYPNTITSLLNIVANDLWSVGLINDCKKSLAFISRLLTEGENNVRVK
ncbi:hypothetical protein [Bartonella sp. DGB1]|uniref:hypothetical protein n=1 Tax=Bartonella sp. DGB1 TaxID=3239807 RepID=UPI00352346A7